MSDERIPITIIGGFLGSGKTTLLNRILREKSGTRFAVLVNDYGEVNIDAKLLSGNDNGTIVDLPNGCICCTLARGLVNAVDSVLLAFPAPEQIIIEASGISSPRQIKQLLDVLELQDSVFVRNTITLVDALNFRKIASAFMFVQDQIESADLLILNKTDLVEENSLIDTVAWLDSIAPGTPIFQTQFSEIPLSILSGLSEGRIPVETVAGSRVDFEAPKLDFNHQDQFLSWTFQTQIALCWDKLQILLDDLPASVIRVKGFVHLVEHPEYQCIVQVAGGQVKLSVEDKWDNKVPSSQIVFIGEHKIPTDELRKRLLACGID